jgi:hypothetical protein
MSSYEHLIEDGLKPLEGVDDVAEMMLKAGYGWMEDKTPESEGPEDLDLFWRGEWVGFVIGTKWVMFETLIGPEVSGVAESFEEAKKALVVAVEAHYGGGK